MPFHRADLAEKRLHLGLRSENLAVKVTRVPLDQDIADIEDDRLKPVRQTLSSNEKGRSPGAAAKFHSIWRTHGASALSPDGP
jgi:hypothetical protein